MGPQLSSWKWTQEFVQPKFVLLSSFGDYISGGSGLQLSEASDSTTAMADSQSLQQPQIVYKILLQSQWQSWKSSTTTLVPGSSQAAHIFKGAGIDLQDGYIHLSTAAQSGGTYEKWFAPNNPAESEQATETQASDRSGEPLVLVEVDLQKVIGEVQWEFAKSRGEAFAHVYNGGIPFVPKGETGEEISAVLRTWQGDEVKKSLFVDIQKE